MALKRGYYKLFDIIKWLLEIAVFFHFVLNKISGIILNTKALYNITKDNELIDLKLDWYELA